MPRVRGVEDGLTTGLDGSMMNPVKRQGLDAFLWRPRLWSMPLIFVYQWRGLRRRPYKVRLRSQYLSFSASGLPIGGLMIVTSSAGRMPWQKAFLQLPCLSVQRRLTAMPTMRRRVSGQKTGVYFSDFVQTWSLWLPRTTMQDLACRGLSIFVFLNG